MGQEGRVHINARIDEELITWLDKQVASKRFRTRSHALEYCVFAFKQAEAEAHEGDSLNKS